jgi:histidine triad (HIT) family protein
MDCIFCKIIKRDIPATIIFEDDDIIAFRDVNPQSPEHILIIPKQHLSSLNATQDSHQMLLGKLMLKAKSLAQDFDKGYRIVINTGEHGGQTVNHIHFHLLAGRPMQWPPG